MGEQCPCRKIITTLTKMPAKVNRAWIIELVFKGRGGRDSRWDGRLLGWNQMTVVNITDTRYSHTKGTEGKPGGQTLPLWARGAEWVWWTFIDQHTLMCNPIKTNTMVTQVMCVKLYKNCVQLSLCMCVYKVEDAWKAFQMVSRVNTRDLKAGLHLEN